MANIKKERTQMGAGDYTIDSPITMEEISAQVGGELQIQVLLILKL